MSAKTTLSPEVMKELIKRNLQIWNDGNFARFDEEFAPNYRNHSSGTDKAALKQAIVAMRQAFPDLHVSVDNQIVEGDKIVTHWSASGTHQGNHYGVAGTGKKMHKALALTASQTERLLRVGEILTSWACFGNWDSCLEMWSTAMPAYLSVKTEYL